MSGLLHPRDRGISDTYGEEIAARKFLANVLVFAGRDDTSALYDVATSGLEFCHEVLSRKVFDGFMMQRRSLVVPVEHCHCPVFIWVESLHTDRIVHSVSVSE